MSCVVSSIITTMGISDFLCPPVSLRFAYRERFVVAIPETHRISHVHHPGICKHAISYNPGSLWLCWRPLLPTKLQASPYQTGWPTAELNEANLFTFVTAYLPLRRALTYALRLRPSSSLTPERTIGRAGLAPASKETLRGAPDSAD